jgi:hypothetical protein
MSELPGFVIPTRQKSDVLFRLTTPLGAGSSVPIDARRVLGYDSIAFLAVSDQPFSISIQEACDPDSGFAQTQVLSSSVAGGQNVVCTRIEPCGALMRLLIANPGPAMTLFDLSGQGIPQP